MHASYQILNVEQATEDFAMRYGEQPQEAINLGWIVIAGPITGCTKIAQRYPVETYQQEAVVPMPRSSEPRSKKLTRYRILERDNFRCVYCGASSLTSETLILHLDHIQPRSKGGKDAASNLAAACEDCNVSKHARVLKLENLKELKAEIKRRNLEAGIEGDCEVACFIFHQDV